MRSWTASAPKRGAQPISRQRADGRLLLPAVLVVESPVRPPAGTLAAPVQSVPTSDLAVRRHHPGQHEAAAANLVPGDLPNQPDQDGAVGPGAQASPGHQSLHRLAHPSEAHACHGARSRRRTAARRCADRRLVPGAASRLALAAEALPTRYRSRRRCC